MRLKKDLFPPGGYEARRLGCSCSAVQNAYGRGHGDGDNRTYVVALACPYHVRDGQLASTGGPAR